jgi:hypothetical protein
MEARQPRLGCAGGARERRAVARRELAAEASGDIRRVKARNGLGRPVRPLSRKRCACRTVGCKRGGGIIT